MARNPHPDKHRRVATSSVPHDATASARRTDEKLDEALKATFPASDPFALTVDEDPNSRATYASPPCFMHEVDPSYMGLQPPREADAHEPADAPEGASEGSPPDATRAKESNTR